MTNEEKSSLLNLISEGKIQVVIDRLLSMEINESNKKEVIAISSRLKKLKQQIRLGVLSFEQTNLAENRISAQLIDLIEHFNDSSISKNELTGHTNPSKLLIGKYIFITVVVIGLLGSILELSNIINIIPTNESPEKLQLTVFVTDSEGNVVLEHTGELNTSIGNRPMRETIGQHGRTNFGDILPEHLGDTITIGFKAEGWEVVDSKKTFVFLML